MTEQLDFPFDEIIEAATKYIKEGATVYQKFTCAGCGQRFTIEDPNTFHTMGACDKCDAITDIRKQGCNYLIVVRMSKMETGITLRKH